MKANFIYLFAVLLTACNNSSEANKTAISETMKNEIKKEEKPTAKSNTSDCTLYYWFKEGAVAEYANKDAEGNETSRTICKVTNVRNENGIIWADFTAATGNNKAITAIYKCEGDKMYMDMKSFFANNFGALAARGGMELEIDNAYLTFPYNMKPGDKLEGTNFKIVAKKDGKPIMTTTNEIKARRVEGTANITTPAGSWNCLKITETSIITSEMMGKQLPGHETKTVNWFAPGIGVVKTGNYDKEGKIISEIELVSLKR
jgi:hypothetical protein